MLNIPNVSIRQIQMCVAVYRLGTLAAASRDLQVTASAISMGIKEAEKQLGCVLFHRGKREMRASDAGRLLFPRMEELLRQFEEFETVLASDEQGLRGHLVIGASSTLGCYVLPEVIASFQAKHPLVDIDLWVANTAEVLEKVARFEVDVAFVEGPSFAGDCELDCLWEDEMVVFGKAGTALTRRRVVKWSDLASERWLLREEGSGTHSILAGAFAKYHLHPSRAIHVGNTEAVIRCVETGLGIACLSRLAIKRSLQMGLIEEIPVPPVKRCFYHACHTRKYIGIVGSQFLEEVKRYCAEL